MKLLLIGQLLGLFIAMFVGIWVIAHIWICFMSWRDGGGFFYWRD